MGRTEEMQPDHVLGPRGRGGDCIDVERGSIGREHGTRTTDPVEVCEDALLEADLLEHCLDDEISAAESRGGGSAAHGGDALRGGRRVELAAAGEILEVASHDAEPAIDRRLIDIDQRRRDTARGERDCDA